MITIKEYARTKNVSYEAVRQQVVRYKKELDGHVFKEKRTQYLDDEAVLFLDQKRAENPIIVLESGKDEELKRLEDENKALLVKITELQEMLLAEKEQVKLLQAEKIELLELRNKEPEKKKWFFRR